MQKATVVVIGGGATGVGILRDLSMRGVDALLIKEMILATEQARGTMVYFIVVVVMQLRMQKRQESVLKKIQSYVELVSTV